MGRRNFTTVRLRGNALTMRQAGPPPPAHPPEASPRAPSRPQRLAALTDEAQSLLAEYEEWLEALPESLKEGEVANRLREVVEQLTGVADQLADIDPPKGFGRD